MTMEREIDSYLDSIDAAYAEAAQRLDEWLAAVRPRPWELALTEDAGEGRVRIVRFLRDASEADPETDVCLIPAEASPFADGTYSTDDISTPWNPRYMDSEHADLMIGF